MTHRHGLPARPVRPLLPPAAGDGGVVSVLLVLLTGALLVLAGLVIDGGRAITGRQHAADIAEQAARAGADRVDLSTLRSTGLDRLDPAGAPGTACGFVRAAHPGDTCTATVTGDRITVRVTTHTPTVFLTLVGIRQFTTTSWATARPAYGVVEESGGVTHSEAPPGGTP